MDQIWGWLLWMVLSSTLDRLFGRGTLVEMPLVVEDGKGEAGWVKSRRRITSSPFLGVQCRSLSQSLRVGEKQTHVDLEEWRLRANNLGESWPAKERRRSFI